VADAVEFIRPAVHAALELGLESLENILEPTLTAASNEFNARFGTAFPTASQADVFKAGHAIHRAIVSALFDKNITAQEFRSEVAALINGYFVTKQAQSANTTIFSEK
jgi:hypothetical protein